MSPSPCPCVSGSPADPAMSWGRAALSGAGSTLHCGHAFALGSGLASCFLGPENQKSTTEQARWQLWLRLRMWVTGTSITAWKKPGLRGTSSSISAHCRPLALRASPGPWGARGDEEPGLAWLCAPAPNLLCSSAGGRLMGSPAAACPRSCLVAPAASGAAPASSAGGEESKAKPSRWPWRRERGLSWSLGQGLVAERKGSAPPGCPTLLAPSPPGEGEGGRVASPWPALAPGEELKAVSFRG